MRYEGKYHIFDASRITTYPLRVRTNRVTIKGILQPQDAAGSGRQLEAGVRADIETLAGSIVEARSDGKPVILITGAHLIKNGCGLLLGDLVDRGLVTLVAGNAATAIHDFELALIGETSEDVPHALARGHFGMAHEFAYINGALLLGNERHIGFGESLGRMICDEAFRSEVLSLVGADPSAVRFEHPEVSVLAACSMHDVPFTVHAGIGTDVIDQHPSFDGEAKGGCSGRDFLIFAHEVTRMTRGGVVLNIGSAVTGPEVLLKAVSMAANTGSPPKGILTAVFDLRPHSSGQMSDESAEGYYFRDQKSVLTRIPQALRGRGIYIQGDQKQTFPFLHQSLLAHLALGAGSA